MGFLSHFIKYYDLYNQASNLLTYQSLISWNSRIKIEIYAKSYESGNPVEHIYCLAHSFALADISKSKSKIIENDKHSPMLRYMFLK